MAEKNYGVSNKAKLLNITRQAEGQTYMRTMKNHRKSGIEKGLEDIRKGNVYRAMNPQDLVKQILGGPMPNLMDFERCSYSIMVLLLKILGILSQSSQTFLFGMSIFQRKVWIVWGLSEFFCEKVRIYQ